jgi:hypothetical protein
VAALRLMPNVGPTNTSVLAGVQFQEASASCDEERGERAMRIQRRLPIWVELIVVAGLLVLAWYLGLGPPDAGGDVRAFSNM